MSKGTPEYVVDFPQNVFDEMEPNDQVLDQMLWTMAREMTESRIKELRIPQNQRTILSDCPIPNLNEVVIQEILAILPPEEHFPFEFNAVRLNIRNFAGLVFEKGPGPLSDLATTPLYTMLMLRSYINIWRSKIRESIGDITLQDMRDYWKSVGMEEKFFNKVFRVLNTYKIHPADGMGGRESIRTLAQKAYAEFKEYEKTELPPAEQPLSEDERLFLTMYEGDINKPCGLKLLTGFENPTDLWRDIQLFGGEQLAQMVILLKYRTKDTGFNGFEATLVVEFEGGDADAIRSNPQIFWKLLVHLMHKYKMPVEMTITVENTENPGKPTVFKYSMSSLETKLRALILGGLAGAGIRAENIAVRAGEIAIKVNPAEGQSTDNLMAKAIFVWETMKRDLRSQGLLPFYYDKDAMVTIDPKNAAYREAVRFEVK